jgi:hypothetical protein
MHNYAQRSAHGNCMTSERHGKGFWWRLSLILIWMSDS